MRWVIAFVPACFSATPPTGLPCAATGECPSGQVCEAATNTCQLAASPGDDAGLDPDALVDPDGDKPPIDCWAAWKGGTPSLSAPRLVTELNSDRREQDPVFSADALTLYFVRADVILRATRPTRTSPFGTPAPVTELDAPGNQTRISLTTDGTLAIFSSSQSGGEGGADLWQATFGNGMFGTPTQVPLGSLNDALDQFDPELPADGLRLYYASFNGPGTIMLATRASLADAFGAPTPIATDLPAGTSMFDPTLSPDELVLVFGTPSGFGANDLHFATRASRNDPFTSRGNLTALDSSASNGDADLSDDGCSIIFGSDRAGGAGSRDLWISDLE